MCKKVQEGYAQKQTTPRISMHLRQNLSHDYIWYVQGFSTSTDTQKGRRPYLYQLFAFAAPTSHVEWNQIFWTLYLTNYN